MRFSWRLVSRYSLISAIIVITSALVAHEALGQWAEGGNQEFEGEFVRVSNISRSGPDIVIHVRPFGELVELATEPFLIVDNTAIKGEVAFNGTGTVTIVFNDVPLDARNAVLQFPSIAVPLTRLESTPVGSTELSGPEGYSYEVIEWLIHEDANIVEAVYRPLQSNAPAITLAKLESSNVAIHAISLSSIYDTSEWELDYGIISFPIKAIEAIEADDVVLTLSRFQVIDQESIAVQIDG